METTTYISKTGKKVSINLNAYQKTFRPCALVAIDADFVSDVAVMLNVDAITWQKAFKYVMATGLKQIGLNIDDYNFNRNEMKPNIRNVGQSPEQQALYKAMVAKADTTTTTTTENHILTIQKALDADKKKDKEPITKAEFIERLVKSAIRHKLTESQITEITQHFINVDEKPKPKPTEEIVF
jgi:hypothetical protein